MAVTRLTEALRPAIPKRTRTSITRLRLRARLATPAPRVLPNFLVIGGQRCGTSSLYKYLGQHPLVLPSLRKETEYFSRHHGRGLAWYLAHFPTRLGVELVDRARGSRPLTFEATPDYLWHPRAASRAAELVPEARIVVLLRDPVQRAWSHHRHMTRLGFETLSFEAALEQEDRRLAGERERILADPSYPGRSFLRFSYFSRGLYLDQLDVWRRRYPTPAVLVIRSEALYADPARALDEVLDFVGLPRWRPRRFRNYSSQPAGVDPPRLPVGAATMLAERYAPHNRRLARALGWASAWEG